MKKICILLLLLVMSKKGYASPKLITSLGFNKLTIVDENLKVPSEINYSFSYGAFDSLKNGITYSLTTNRGIEIENKTPVQINANKKFAELKTKITSDVFTVGYRDYRSVYSFNLFNVKKRSRLGAGYQEKHAIMYGLSYQYLISKKVILVLTALAPNHGMGVRNGVILTLGYLW